MYFVVRVGLLVFAIIVASVVVAAVSRVVAAAAVVVVVDVVVVVFVVVVLVVALALLFGDPNGLLDPCQLYFDRIVFVCESARAEFISTIEPNIFVLL